MLDISLKPQKQPTKTQKRVNPRLSTMQMESLNQFCEKNSIKSRSKVVKAALDLALTGNSDIDFSDNFKVDYSKEPRKTLDFDKDKKILTVCPHCNGKVRLDSEHWKKFKHTVTEKIEVLPSFVPAFLCSDLQCVDIHPNPNYKVQPQAYCSKCNQFAKGTTRNICPWCRTQGTLLQNPLFRLDFLGIPNPESK